MDSLSEQIYNESDFFYKWAYDPTVASMLTMIDAIHNYSKEYNLSNQLFGILKVNAPITFQFIDLDSFQLEDTLYIKMNARGKPLTQFENFKARFQQYLEGVDMVDGKEILFKIDTVWSDFFWKHQKKNYDESFLQFFYALLYNQLARHPQNRNDLFAAINGGEVIRFDDLTMLSIENEQWVKDIEVTLDILSEQKLDNQQSVINIKRVINEAMTHGINYEDRVQLYGIVAYVRHFNDDFAVFSRWMRFVRNVIVNTIYNRVEDYMQSIQAIDRLVTHAENLNEYLADPNVKLSGFFGSQLSQEKLKANLFLGDEAWENHIHIAEDYRYFEGEIGFLLTFIDADSYKEWTEGEHKQKQSSFTSYYEKAIEIFGETKLNVSNNLLSRALLTTGDYLIKTGQNYSFLIEGFDRDISWKRYLRHDHVRYLKQLLDKVTPDTVEKGLQQIIDESKVTDWRKYFIKYPLILAKKCGNKRLIRFHDENNILLLDTTMTSGYCQEYYSYAIYAALQQKGITCTYRESVGAYNEKYVELDQGGYTLDFDDEKFIVYDANENIIDKIEDFNEALDKMCELAGIDVK
ncbi:hypothetical protein GH885_09695 [Gracilibacillus thailandensis]|uniref:Uncharacterized protein n=2 Tax=Gracilibacillus thailandensis TaxID=563735 RepID=A0A6N7R0P0_9BACI|nr:hypothetical protein [Gracilibacillus thailandensis]